MAQVIALRDRSFGRLLVAILISMAVSEVAVDVASHTPHVDALGVIAVGVGGLEAENVMLGRASWMRLPDIVGVELCQMARAKHLVLFHHEPANDDATLSSFASPERLASKSGSWTSRDAKPRVVRF